MANASSNSSRIKKMQAAVAQRHRAYIDGMNSDEFREYSRRVLRGVSREEAARSMREHGYTEEMVEKSLSYIYDGEDSFVYRPRR